MVKLSTNQIISAFVMIIVGASLVGPIANIIFTAANDSSSNITGASSAIYLLIPLFFVMILVVGAVKYIR